MTTPTDFPTPYDVQLTHDATVHTSSMAIVLSQRQPGATGRAYQHFLPKGVYLVSLTYDGAQSTTLRHMDGDVQRSADTIPGGGTAGVQRTTPYRRISVTSDDEYLNVVSNPSATGGTARATISVIPFETYKPT